MLKLLRYYSVSFIRREWLRLLVAVLGVIASVALCTAVHTTNKTALQSFEQTGKVLADEFPFEIHSASGFLSQELYPALSRVEEIKHLVPHSERVVSMQTKDKRTIRVRLYGIDLVKTKVARSSADSVNIREFLAASNPVLLSEPLAERLSTGSSQLLLSGKQVPFIVSGTVPAHSAAEQYFLITDIGHFQRMTETAGTVDFFRLQAEAGVSQEQLQQAISGILPEATRVVSSDNRSFTMQRATQAFRLNIQFLGAISLVVALLLVYTFISFLVLKRRCQFAVLRSIGISPRSIFYTVIAEALMLGFAGSILGYGVGLKLAGYLINDVAQTIDTLYVPTPLLAVSGSISNFILAVVLGTGACMLAALLPAAEAVRIPPVQALSYQQYESLQRGNYALLAGAGLILTVGSILMARPALLTLSLVAGCVPPLLFIVGTLALLPLCSGTLLGYIRSYARKRSLVTLSLASGHMLETVRRNATSIAALSVTLGTVLGIAVLIYSFRSTVTNWIQSITVADLYISADAESRGKRAELPEPLLPFVSSLPGVRDVDTISAVQSEFSTEIRGTRFSILRKYQRLPLLRGALPKMEATDDSVAYISESFSNKHMVSIEDMLLIPGTRRRFPVAGVFQDYSTEHGVILISDRLFSELFPDIAPHGISLFLQPEAEPDRVRAAVSEAFSETPLAIRNRRALREHVERVFDETFQVTYVLQSVSTLIAIFVLVNATLMLLLERREETAVLHAIGVSKMQIRRLFISETLLIGSLAVLFGSYLGAGLSLFLVFVVNVFFFGWLVSFAIPWGTVGVSILGVLLLSFLIGAVCTTGSLTKAIHSGGHFE